MLSPLISQALAMARMRERELYESGHLPPSRLYHPRRHRPRGSAGRIR